MTVTKKDDKSYSEVGQLTIYPAILGRDSDLVQRAWEAVGGTGGFPCDNASGLDMLTGVSISTHESVYAVGTLTITNETADFDSSDMRWDFAAGLPADGKHFAMGFGLSNGSECDSLDGGTLTSPNVTGPTLGPRSRDHRLQRRRDTQHTNW